jgi:rod shape-determining protein MreC
MEVLGQESRENFGRRTNSRFVLVLMILASFILLASSLYSAEASVFKKARESVMDFAAPALEVLARPFAFLQERVGDVRDYFNVLDKNQALREENAELRQWMEEAIRLRGDIKTFERLQDFAADLETTPIDAFIIGESNDAFSKSMLVNAGAEDGVRRGMAVIDERGLLGRIVEVGQRSSRVLLLTDVQSGVPVFIEETGLEGILKGRTGARPAIDFAAATVPVVFKPGQRVITSGAGGALPRGIVVGRVIGDAKGQAIVDLNAKYASARLVRVMNYQFPEFTPSSIQDDPNAPFAINAGPAHSFQRGPLQPPPGPSQRAALEAAAQAAAEAAGGTFTPGLASAVRGAPGTVPPAQNEAAPSQAARPSPQGNRTPPPTGLAPNAAEPAAPPPANDGD